MAMETYTWKIGELAEATGVTVRTLHHYDDIGLLAPAERSDSGHRLYGRDEVQRLYRIVALRQLGMSLDDIKGVLASQTNDPREVVRKHLADLSRQIDLQEQLRERLAAILETLEQATDPSTEDFIRALEVMTMIDSYYTPEQLAQLEERRKQLGDEGMQKGQQDWADLIADAQRLKEAGADPASDEVQAIAIRWEDLISQFTGGDPAIKQSLQTMYETEGPEKASRGMVDPELMAWIGHAMEARPKGV
ncbi:MAG: MerR family transcriptional regulator, thiopeptide resistance regulator [Actinomycetota bacterium]|jgi:DNA-binding transcriptional MerR regulator|nr:MerR family transcriptional regulator, thiopeptide resistance regulator [Actinomycetota bacterium]